MIKKRRRGLSAIDYEFICSANFSQPIEKAVQRECDVAAVTCIIALHQRLQHIIEGVMQYRWQQIHAKTTRLLYHQQKHLIQFLDGLQSVRCDLYSANKLISPLKSIHFNLTQSTYSFVVLKNTLSISLMDDEPNWICSVSIMLREKLKTQFATSSLTPPKWLNNCSDFAMIGRYAPTSICFTDELLSRLKSMMSLSSGNTVVITLTIFSC